MKEDDNKIGAIDFMRLFLASVLGAIAGIMFSRIGLYSPTTQTLGILWFFSASLLLYIIYFYTPQIIVELLPKPKISKNTKKILQDKNLQRILILLLTLLLLFIVFDLPRMFPAWFNS
jgi:hypothetical protein